MNSGAQHHTAESAASASNDSGTVVTVFEVGKYPGNPATGQGQVGDTNVVWAVNIDGDWVQHGFLKGTTKQAGGTYFSVRDASVAWDARARKWVIVMDGLNDTVGLDVDEIAFTSTNGTDWTGPIFVNQALTNVINNGPFVRCDNHSASPFYGNCYTSFTQGTPSAFGIVLSTSTDGGTHWGPVVASNVPAFFGTPLVQPDGTVVEAVAHVHPTPQGEAPDSVWSLIYAPATASFTYAALACTACQVNTFIDASDANFLDGVASVGQVDGKIYSAWGTCNAACNTNILVESTTTDGKHWSTPVQLPTVGADVGQPSLAAIQTSDGTVLALSYDAIDQNTLATRFMASQDGGTTWNGEVTLGSANLGWFSQEGGSPSTDFSATVFQGQDPVTSFPLAVQAPQGTILFQNEYAAQP